MVEAVIPDKEGFWSGFYLERCVTELPGVGELLGRASGSGTYLAFA